MNRIKSIIFLVIFGVLCVLVVAQIGLNSTQIKVPTNQKKEVLWDVVFKPLEGSNDVLVEYTDNVEYTLPQLFDSIVNDFDVKFNKPQEEITYTFNMINNSEYDGYILQYNKPVVSCKDDNDLCKNYLDKIKYTFKYEDGTDVKQNDIIKSKETKKVIIKIEYKENTEEVPMSLTKLGFSLTFAKVE